MKWLYVNFWSLKSNNEKGTRVRSGKTWAIIEAGASGLHSEGGPSERGEILGRIL